MYNKYHLIFIYELYQEIATSGKSIVQKGLSIPAGQNAPQLYEKLKQSQYLNAYIDKYMYLDYIAGMNDHLKAVISYGFNYLESSINSEQ
jgi:hypothetical protein